ncbi:hypothetical protein DFH07DRAFT_772889 [Mycena maculata]|uniref:Uncharacterized protein n=1 Tax=Mycena maculata TaxID=230809 RepID=A0AAD7J6J5_9AGAR|nr:hypothetical protein DFH07DRAFT_772889 [Mycena maculata]
MAVEAWGGKLGVVFLRWWRTKFFCGSTCTLREWAEIGRTEVTSCPQDGGGQNFSVVVRKLRAWKIAGKIEGTGLTGPLRKCEGARWGGFAKNLPLLVMPIGNNKTRYKMGKFHFVVHVPDIHCDRVFGIQKFRIQYFRGGRSPSTRLKSLTTSIGQFRFEQELLKQFDAPEKRGEETWGAIGYHRNHALPLGGFRSSLQDGVRQWAACALQDPGAVVQSFNDLGEEDAECANRELACGGFSERP